MSSSLSQEQTRRLRRVAAVMMADSPDFADAVQEAALLLHCAAELLREQLTSPVSRSDLAAFHTDRLRLRFREASAKLGQILAEPQIDELVGSIITAAFDLAETFPPTGARQ
jgi:hypothetical protein